MRFSLLYSIIYITSGAVNAGAGDAGEKPDEKSWRWRGEVQPPKGAERQL